MTKTIAKLELENERLKARLSNNTLDSQNQQLAEQRDDLVEQTNRMQQRQQSLTSQIDRLQKLVKSQDVPESE